MLCTSCIIRLQPCCVLQMLLLAPSDMANQRDSLARTVRQRFLAVLECCV